MFWESSFNPILFMFLIVKALIWMFFANDIQGYYWKNCF